jgi:uncharacterized protein (TIRG00374 family)
LTASRSAHRPRWRFVVVPLVLAVAAYLVHRLVAAVGWRDLVDRLRDASPAWLLAAAGCVLLHLWLWGYRWKVAIRRVDARPRRRVIYAALAAAASVNLVAPFARVLGGLLRARYLARSGSHSLAAFYGVVLFDQIAHLVVMTALTGAAVVCGLWLLGRDLASMALGLVLAATLAAFFFWEERLTAHGPQWIADWLESRSRRHRGLRRSAFARGHETLRMLAGLLADRGLRFEAAGLGIALFLASALAQGAVFAALGEHPGALVVAVTVALGTAAGTLAGTPGGLGATEAAMIALYVALDVDRLDAAAAALAYRGVYYAVVFATGVPSAAILEWRLGKTVAATDFPRPEAGDEKR